MGRILFVTAGVAAGIATAAPKPGPELRATGKALYEGQVGCFACHGLTGAGNGPVAFAIKPPPRDFTKEPFKNGDSLEQIFGTITNGLPNTKMVGYPQLSEDDRWALASYVQSFRPKK